MKKVKISDEKLRRTQTQKQESLGLTAKPRQPDIKTMVVLCKRCKSPIEMPVVSRLVGEEKNYAPRLCSECIAADKKREREDVENSRCESVVAAKRQRQSAIDAICADLPGALASVGVPAHYLSASFETCTGIPDDILEPAREWSKNPDGFLFLHGCPGSGKTWLAVAVIRFCLAAGTRRLSEIKFISERGFLDSIKAAFGNESAPIPARRLPPDEPTCIRLLLLDDLGANRMTTFALTEVAGLIAARYDDDLPTIITSNLSPDEVGAVVDVRTISRIAESDMMFEFPTRDLRIAGRTEGNVRE